MANASPGWAGPGVAAVLMLTLLLLNPNGFFGGGQKLLG